MENSHPFKVNARNLMQEVLVNNTTQDLKIGFIVFSRILGEIADYALNKEDDILTALCCQLQVYSQSEFGNADYDEEEVKRLDKILADYRKKLKNQ